MVAESLYLPQSVEESNSCILLFLPFHIKIIPTCVPVCKCFHTSSAPHGWETLFTLIWPFLPSNDPFYPQKQELSPGIRVHRTGTPQGSFCLSSTAFQEQLSEITSIQANLSCWDTILLYFCPSFQCLYLLVGFAFFKLTCRNREFIFSKHGNWQVFCKYKAQSSSKKWN